MSIIKRTISEKKHIEFLDEERPIYSAKYYIDTKILEMFVNSPYEKFPGQVIIENISDEKEAEKLFKSITIFR